MVQSGDMHLARSVSCTPRQLIAKILVCISYFTLCLAATPNAAGQLDTFNSTTNTSQHEQTAALIAAAGLPNATSQGTQVAVDFERSNWATGSVREDAFYQLLANASSLPPGSVLRIEDVTNTTQYTLAPNLALSRMLYQTETFNGTAVPASAFVLWPWSAKRFPNITGYPVVAWAHGTSGTTPECAPSHTRNLWYQFFAPYTLATQGYVVVGIDYAGLGVGQTPSGEEIVHQWGASQAGANDIAYAVEAAQQAWPELSKDYVVMGHSQGGGVAWASAQRQAQTPAEGYLGSVVGSPLVDFSSYALEAPAQVASVVVPYLSTTIGTIFPEFDVCDWLKPAGVRILELFRALNGCQSTRLELFGSDGDEYLKADWNTTWYFDTFNKLVGLGGKTVSGPLLVLQGMADDQVNPQDTTNAVNKTCGRMPNTSLQYITFEGVTHVPELFASQQIWLDWIAARFNKEPTHEYCTNEHHTPIRPVDTYDPQVNYFLEYPLYGYEVA